MALPFLAPVLVTAAAAAAGWYGARWWSRAFSGGRPSLNTDAAAGNRPEAPRSSAKVRTMMWCAECGAYVVPENTSDCAQPGCQMRR
ncbi:MAG: hypothetical protein H6905_09945 [Hyphomicrobiales bacterium]|nr:hypothetical protein [Hyphomicrobiales bacterium]